MFKNFIIGKVNGLFWFRAILYTNMEMDHDEVKKLYDKQKVEAETNGWESGFCGVMNYICEKNPGWYWEDWIDAVVAIEVDA